MFFKSTKHILDKRIAEYLEKGWLPEDLKKDKELCKTLVWHIKNLKKLGIDFDQILRIIVLGQVEDDPFKIASIKDGLMHNRFDDSFNSEVFDVTRDFVNLEQIVLRNGDVFVIAEYSPADYFNSREPGFLWKIKISKELELHPNSKAELTFEAK